MDGDALRQLLEEVRAGTLMPEQAVDLVQPGPLEEDVGFAVLDHHRVVRRGFPEVIYGSGKTAEQIATLLERIHGKGHNGMATRVAPEKAREIVERLPGASCHELARIVTLSSSECQGCGRGPVAVITAGTSDIPVAEEAAVSAEQFGNEVIRINDVGVAGLHRLLNRMDLVRKATVLIVVAGMEGALPSVVSGLVDLPVIAVPTSVGYGASFGGLAALLGMLNSCASGVTVVNIDNGFGAAYAATLINKR